MGHAAGNVLATWPARLTYAYRHWPSLEGDPWVWVQYAKYLGTELPDARDDSGVAAEFRMRRVFERAIEYCSRINIGAAHTFSTTMAGIGPKITVAPILCGYRTRRRPFSARSAIVRTEQPDAAILTPLRQQSQRILRAWRGDKGRGQRQPSHRAGIAQLGDRFRYFTGTNWVVNITSSAGTSLSSAISMNDALSAATAFGSKVPSVLKMPICSS